MGKEFLGQVVITSVCILLTICGTIFWTYINDIKQSIDHYAQHISVDQIKERKEKIDRLIRELDELELRVFVLEQIERKGT